MRGRRPWCAQSARYGGRALRRVPGSQGSGSRQPTGDPTDNPRITTQATTKSCITHFMHETRTSPEKASRHHNPPHQREHPHRPQSLSTHHTDSSTPRKPTRHRPTQDTVTKNPNHQAPSTHHPHHQEQPETTPSTDQPATRPLPTPPPKAPIMHIMSSKSTGGPPQPHTPHPTNLNHPVRTHHAPPDSNRSTTARSNRVRPDTPDTSTTGLPKTNRNTSDSPRRPSPTNVNRR